MCIQRILRLNPDLYGEPRLTADVDVVVELNLPQAAKLCAAFPAPEYYVSETAARQAVARGGQFNVGRQNGVGGNSLRHSGC
jgi:hypothetical protein